jgi:hypothetical protein
MKSPTAPDAAELARVLGLMSVFEESVKIMLEMAKRHVEELSEMRSDAARMKETLLAFQGK